MVCESHFGHTTRPMTDPHDHDGARHAVGLDDLSLWSEYHSRSSMILLSHNPAMYVDLFISYISLLTPCKAGKQSVSYVKLELVYSVAIPCHRAVHSSGLEWRIVLRYLGLRKFPKGTFPKSHQNEHSHLFSVLHVQNISSAVKCTKRRESRHSCSVQPRFSNGYSPYLQA